MKWLIILCNLIIFSFGVLRAETDSDEHEDKCTKQLLIEYTRASNCTDEIVENNDNFNELITTLLEYSNDEAAIRALAAKNCPIGEQLLECSVFSDDVDEECTSTYMRDVKNMQLDISKTVLNYACANNATVLLRVLENNGIRTIFENKKAFECLRIMDRDNTISGDREQGLNIIPLCNGFDRVRECYANLVQDHDNKNLVPIVNELHVLIRQTLKCPTVINLTFEN